MTDLDYEILEAVSKFPEGVLQSQLEEQYFQGYRLTYNLQELSRKEITEVGGVRISFSNSNVLEAKEVTIKNIGGIRSFYYIYFITPRGRAILENWKRRRAEIQVKEYRQKRTQWVLNLATGVITGILATLIYSRFLNL